MRRLICPVFALCAAPRSEISLIKDEQAGLFDIQLDPTNHAALVKAVGRDIGNLTVYSVAGNSVATTRKGEQRPVAPRAGAEMNVENGNKRKVAKGFDYENDGDPGRACKPPWRETNLEFAGAVGTPR